MRVHNVMMAVEFDRDDSDLLLYLTGVFKGAKLQVSDIKVEESSWQ
jgi:hypothetical protein